MRGPFSRCTALPSQRKVSLREGSGIVWGIGAFSDKMGSIRMDVTHFEMPLMAGAEKGLVRVNVGVIRATKGRRQVQ